MNEPVLIIPMVLALLGDNPMQSEFACHIGLKGKFFCRACWVKGSDALAETAPQRSGSPRASSHGSDGDGASDDRSGSEAPEGSGNGAAASAASDKQVGGRRRKAVESMSSMVDRAKAFLKVEFPTPKLMSVSRHDWLIICVQIGRPRHKVETTAQLKSMFTEASTLNSKTKVQAMRTESGVKDTYQMFFLDKLFRSYKKKRGRESKQAALEKEIESLPDIITSPIWRINGRSIAFIFLMI